MTQLKFRKYLNKRCPDCDGKLKLIDITEDENGASYTESYEICDNCGYEENIKDKRSKNNKVEID
jgi:hypothetical protein